MTDLNSPLQVRRAKRIQQIARTLYADGEPCMYDAYDDEPLEVRALYTERATRLVDEFGLGMDR